MLSFSSRHILACFAVLTLTGLAGCGVSNPADENAAFRLNMHGVVMGGNQLLGYSTIQLWAANTAGSIATGYGSASAAQIPGSVQADANGNFTLTGLYTCPTPTSQMYLTAVGGNPGLAGGAATNNQAIALVAALGSCNTLTATTQITINEATTVGAIVALAPFFSTYDHLGTSSTNIAGLQNAFAMSGNLANYSTGQSVGTGPTGSVIPTAEIYTLANVLASCVNTTGSTATGTNCGNLFSYTTVGGVAPTNTADAMINIAKNPSSNVTNLFNLTIASSPFQPTLASAPNDWTVAVSYRLSTVPVQGLAFDASGNALEVDTMEVQKFSTAGYLLASASAGAMSNPGGYSVAIASDGNVWTGGMNGFAKYLPSLGVPANSYTSYVTTSGQLNNLAFDASGNLLLTCNACTSIYRYSSTGGTLSPFSYATATSNAFYNNNISVANDGNLWLGNRPFNGGSPATVSAFTSAGVALSGSPFSCGSTCNIGYLPKFVANDSSGNGWVASYSLYKLTPSGTLTAFPVINGGVYQANGVALDGVGTAWVSSPQNYLATSYAGGLGAYTNSGTQVTPNNGYVSTTLAAPKSVAVDRSGNVWMVNGNATTTNGTAYYTATVFAGVATPVLTPFAVGVANGTLATKP